MMNLPYSKTDVENASRRVFPYVHKTPVLTSRLINDIVEGELYFKCENFQKAGSFKIRGATNAILQLSKDQQSKGVITHSSGNFAQALAFAAKNMGVAAYIVMPENAPQVKVDAVKGYGAEIRFCESTQAQRESTMHQWQAETDATFLHPYDNKDVILGQSTCAYEIFKEVEDLDNIIAPVGGGGLVSGTALSTYFCSPSTKIYAAEPEGANDAWRSFMHGEIFPSIHPNTIADGLLTSLGEHTFPIIQKLVSDILIITDEEIIDAMKLIWTRMKIIVEPSSATTLAAVLRNKKLFADKKTAIILSGGNADVNKLPF